MHLASTSRFLLFSLLALAGLTGPARAGILAERVATGLAIPTYVTAPPGDAERVLILEQAGLIKILRNGIVEARPFLDITAEVNAASPEQGLLGLTFHPDFTTNRYCYVYYVTGTGAGTTVLRRFTVSTDPDSVDVTSGLSIIQFPQPTPSHNGGHVDFGPDGYLYLGLGDGGGIGDPSNRAQNPLSLLGKMLRIDVDGDAFPSDSLRNYSVPPSNPFVGDASTRDEIWALGLRNPYRFDFDPQSGDLYIADVGQFCWEEVNYQPGTSTGGENYGWRILEGSHCYDPSNAFDCDPPITCDDPTLTAPVFDYFHTGGAGSCWAVIGGTVYRGSAIPEIQGHYFFADYCRGKVWSFRVEGGSVVDLVDRTTELGMGTGSITFPSAIGRDGLGEMYLADWQSSGSNGELFKIVPDPSVDAPAPAPGAASFRLSNGQPNPFRGATRFELSLERGARVSASVHDASGRLVRRLRAGRANAGVTGLEWDGRDDLGRPVAAGVYFLRVESSEATATRSVTLLR